MSFPSASHVEKGWVESVKKPLSNQPIPTCFDAKKQYMADGDTYDFRVECVLQQQQDDSISQKFENWSPTVITAE